MASDLPPPAHAELTTNEVARRLGLAVRSVQLMVDRGELQAWKTPGGHRRISLASVLQWEAGRGAGPAKAAAPAPAPAPMPAPANAAEPPHQPAPGGPRVLLIEDSVHYQNLIRLLVGGQFPQVSLQVADDGITGLALYGQFQPDVLIVDILLPGIDGATLVTQLKSHPQFTRSKLIVVTSLGPQEREPYAFALQGVPVVHKPNLVRELPAILAPMLQAPPAEPPA